MDYFHLPAISCVYSDKKNLNSFSREEELMLMQPEAHFEYEMILVTGGSGTATINHKAYPIKEKSLIFISPYEKHYFQVESEIYCRYVVTMSSDLILSNIRDVELAAIFVQSSKRFPHVISLSDPAYNMILPLFERLERENRQKDAFYVSRSASIVVAILIDLYRTHPEVFQGKITQASLAVINAQKYINEHFHERISLEVLASQNFISSHGLSLAFKECVGISFKEYLIGIRILEAKKMLVTTHMSVEEIAGAVGYMNVNNFVQIFKKKEDITPLQYRKKFSAL